MPSMATNRAPGMQLGGALAATDVDEVVRASPCSTSAGTSHRRSASLRLPEAMIAAELTGETSRTEAAIEGVTDALGGALRVVLASDSCRASRAPGLRSMTLSRSCARGRVEERGDLGAGLSHVEVAGRGHDRRHRRQTLRVVDRESAGRSSRPSTRPRRGPTVTAEGVEHGDGVVGHVRRVGTGRWPRDLRDGRRRRP